MSKQASALDGLIHLAQAAAEAGEDWLTLLRRQWIPAWIREYPRAALVESIGEWGVRSPTPEEDMAAAMEAAVLAALAEAGYC